MNSALSDWGIKLFGFKLLSLNMGCLVNSQEMGRWAVLTVLHHSDKSRSRRLINFLDEHG
jgi:hypothetical protein